MPEGERHSHQGQITYAMIIQMQRRYAHGHYMHHIAPEREKDGNKSRGQTELATIQNHNENNQILTSPTPILKYNTV